MKCPVRWNQESSWEVFTVIWLRIHWKTRHRATDSRFTCPMLTSCSSVRASSKLWIQQGSPAARTTRTYSASQNWTVLCLRTPRATSAGARPRQQKLATPNASTPPTTTPGKHRQWLAKGRLLPLSPRSYSTLALLNRKQPSSLWSTKRKWYRTSHLNRLKKSVSEQEAPSASSTRNKLEGGLPRPISRDKAPVRRKSNKPVCM